MTVLRGTFGWCCPSRWTQPFRATRPVWNWFRRRLPVTIGLAVLSLLFGVAVGVVAGILSAIRQDSALDYLARIGSMLGLAVPGFWIATLVIMLPAIWWGRTV